MIEKMKLMVWFTLRIPFSFLSRKRVGKKFSDFIDGVEFRLSLKEFQAKRRIDEDDEDWWDDGNLGV
jgi:hypothetical protein